MSEIKCVLFDCDGTLVDSEILCCEAYVIMLARYGVHMTLKEVIKEFKGVSLYTIIDTVKQRHTLEQPVNQLEKDYRDEVARLFEERLQPIAGIRELLRQIIVPLAVVSNGPVNKMRHSLGLTQLLPFFQDRLYSGYDLGKWKPDPALIRHAATELAVETNQCILVEDSVSGVRAGIGAGIPVFYYCADPHNPPIDHPLVTRFDDMGQLPALWRERGWILTRAPEGFA
ncbi:6-phosphogluconate phosphatase [Martelella alba]|uniref:6-phosphogluconate phosphatase n=1 Tax=Martelella alba TaxID=2590451 RepID=A0ABY2SJ22_9HYPH|nr:6-phosphogluconate phosphatase [Martelella alba]TKI04465.1 6-phosphogluconate phosphatase [Martelella alba]